MQKILFVFVLVAFLVPCNAYAQEAGQDDDPREGTIYSPQFSPSNRSIIAYERQVGDARELFLFNSESGEIQKVSAKEESSEEEGALQGFLGATDQNLRLVEGQLAWRPVLDPSGRQWFVFVSSTGEAGYGLYLSYVESDGDVGDRVISLPFDGQAGLPVWSPQGRQIVFSGSPAGSAGYNLYLFPAVEQLLAGESGSGAPVKLTNHPDGAIHPAWSPSGDYIAYQTQQESGGIRNWGINLLDLTSWGGPESSGMPRSVRMTGALNAYHEYKPSWAPTGRYLAFYVTQSEVGSAGENRQQDIGVLIPETGARGQVQGGRMLRGFSGRRLVRNVLVNESRGPQWYPSTNQHSVIYVGREEAAGNPIYLADVTRWNSNESSFSRALSEQFESPTRLHEEVTPTLVPGGLRLAFASQVGDNLRLQVRDVASAAASTTPSMTISKEVSSSTAALRSSLFPGLGQFYRGQPARGWAFTAAGVAAIAATAATTVLHQSAVSDYNDFVASVYSKENLATLSEAEIEEKTSELQTLYDDATSAKSIRNVAIASLAGVWIANVVTSFWGPEYTTEPVYAGSSLRIQQPRFGLVADGASFRPKISLRVQF